MKQKTDKDCVRGKAGRTEIQEEKDPHSNKEANYKHRRDQNTKTNITEEDKY